MNDHVPLPQGSYVHRARPYFTFHGAITVTKKDITGLLFAFALLATACGASTGDELSAGVATLQDTSVPATSDGSASGTPDAGDTDQVTDDEAQLLAFAACMRENGVDMADPTVDADGNLRLARPRNLDAEDRGSLDETNAARDLCSQYLDGVELGFQERDQTELQDQLLDFTSCMRENGYDMPDIQFGGSGGGAGGAGGGAFAEIDEDDPDYQAAFEVCGETFGGVVPGAGGGAGRGGAGVGQGG